MPDDSTTPKVTIVETEPGMVEVYNPYSSQMKGRRKGWVSRQARNANKRKRSRKPKGPVRPTDPSPRYAIDPYYDSKEWRDLREAALQRDGHRCRYCGGVAHQADHVIPRGQKGPDTLSNLVACCWVCNKTAGGRKFPNIHVKKRWILAHRDETTVERREIPPKPAPCFAPKPKTPGKLRARLIAKHQSLSE